MSSCWIGCRSCPRNSGRPAKDQVSEEQEGRLTKLKAKHKKRIAERLQAAAEAGEAKEKAIKKMMEDLDVVSLDDEWEKFIKKLRDPWPERRDRRRR